MKAARKKDQKLQRLAGILFLSCACLLSACQFPFAGWHDGTKGKDRFTVTGFAFDTTYTLTAYQGGSQELLESCIAQCNKYEEIFSRTREGSELYRINYLQRLYGKLVKERKDGKHRLEKGDAGKSSAAGEAGYQKLLMGQWDTKGEIPSFTIDRKGRLQVELSDTLAELVGKGLQYSKLSQGRFDISIAPVSQLWNFSGTVGTPPAAAEIQEALKLVDYRQLKLSDHTLTYQKPGMELELGGIAKGYIADRLKEYLLDGGVASGLINLGGNIVCIGRKTEKEAFQIGIQQPFGDRNETIAAVRGDNNSIVSSGVYERYIRTEDGKLYHHILDPKTGYSCENNLLGVTVLSQRSVDGDGLSTTAFALGLEAGMELIDSLDGVEAVFVTSDQKLHYSKGFEAYLIQL